MELQTVAIDDNFKNLKVENINDKITTKQVRIMFSFYIFLIIFLPLLGFFCPQYLTRITQIALPSYFQNSNDLDFITPYFFSFEINQNLNFSTNLHQHAVLSRISSDLEEDNLTVSLFRTAHIHSKDEDRYIHYHNKETINFMFDEDEINSTYCLLEPTDYDDKSINTIKSYYYFFPPNDPNYRLALVSEFNNPNSFKSLRILNSLLLFPLITASICFYVNSSPDSDLFSYNVCLLLGLLGIVSLFPFSIFPLADRFAFSLFKIVLEFALLKENVFYLFEKSKLKITYIMLIIHMIIVASDMSSIIESDDYKKYEELFFSGHNFQFAFLRIISVFLSQIVNIWSLFYFLLKNYMKETDNVSNYQTITIIIMLSKILFNFSIPSSRFSIYYIYSDYAIYVAYIFGAILYTYLHITI